MRRAIGVGVFVFAACQTPEPPIAPSPRVVAARAPLTDVPDASAVLTEADAAADVTGTESDAAASQAWVVFESPAFVSETPMHGGPDWHLSSNRLPALSRGKDAVTVLEALDTSLSGTPSARLVTLAVSNGKSRGDVPLLGTEEFYVPKRGPNAAVEYAKLAEVVHARVDKANASLETSGATSMIACQVREEPYSLQPPCSMPEQHIDCDGVEIAYRSQTLTSTSGKRSSMRRFPAWRPQPYVSSAGPISVKECFVSFYIDAAHTIGVGELVYMCQAGGDWCSVEPAWRVVTL